MKISTITVSTWAKVFVAKKFQVVQESAATAAPQNKLRKIDKIATSSTAISEKEKRPTTGRSNVRHSGGLRRAEHPIAGPFRRVREQHRVCMLPAGAPGCTSRGKSIMLFGLDFRFILFSREVTVQTAVWEIKYWLNV